MTDSPRTQAPQPFDSRTVELLVSIDPYLSTGDEYMTRDFKLLGRRATERMRRASPADHAQARLVRAGMRDPALARYEDKVRLVTLMSPHAEVPLDETLADLLSRMTDTDRAEAQDIIDRVRQQPAPPAAGEEAAIAEMAKLLRIEYQARAFAEQASDPGAASEANLLADLAHMRDLHLCGQPEWGITITADEAAAKLDDLNEQHPAEPAA